MPSAKISNRDHRFDQEEAGLALGGAATIQVHARLSPAGAAGSQAEIWPPGDTLMLAATHRAARARTRRRAGFEILIW